MLEFDGASDTDLTHRYLWGPAVDQILADEEVASLASAGDVHEGATDELSANWAIFDRNAPIPRKVPPIIF